MNKSQLVEFLTSKPVMVLSTTSPSNAPQSAAVAFGVTSGAELIFSTAIDTRKYANLQSSQTVSAVIGWDNAQTIQYEGNVRELDIDTEAELAEPYFVKNPFMRKLKDLETQKFFVVTPSWVRFTDISTRPWTEFIIEL